jgi:hypothetical protein
MSNVRTILYLNFAWAFLVVQAIMVPYYRSKGLSFEQIAVIGSVFSVCLLLLDLPTGYIADVFGRKRAIVIASLFKGLGGTLLFLWPTFYGFIAAFTLIGIGNSLFSGTDIALLYDAHDDAGETAQTHSSLLARRFQWGQLGAASSAIVGGFLAQRSLDLTIEVNAVIAWSSFLLALTLKDSQVRMPHRVNHSRNFLNLIYKIGWQTPRTRILLLHRIFLSALLLLQMSQLQILWTVLKIPLAWFGVLWAAHGLFAILFSRLSIRWERRLSYNTLLVMLVIIPVAGFLGSAFALQIGIFGVAFTILFELERGLLSSISSAELNSGLPAENRALGNSIVSMGSRAVFIALAPLAGRLVDRGGLSVLFLLFALITLVGAGLLSIPLAKTSRE